MWRGVVWGKLGEKDYKRAREILRDDEWVYYLNCGDGFMAAYRCENLKLYTKYVRSAVCQLYLKTFVFVFN